MYIPYGRQDINNDDIEAVIKVLKSDYLTQGPQVNLFEEKTADYVGSNFAVSFNSATSALHASCSALGLESDDILWTSPNTFVASANCARYLSAKVDFVDIDEETGNICIEKYKEKLIKAEKIGKLPKIFVPVHFAGKSCDMKEIYNLSRKYGIKIIEDASHAIGGCYKGSYVGSCKYSDITVFSFHPVKIITSAEGGMAMTNDKSIADKLNIFRTHGIVKNKLYLKNQNEGPWYYEQQDLGFNYRLSDLQSALGISQLCRTDEFVKKRNEIAQRYITHLEKLPLKILKQDDYCLSSYHLFVIKVKPSLRKNLFEKMRSINIGVQVHYIPVHLHPYYVNLGFKKGDFPISEKFYSEIISIPIFPKLKDEEQLRVINFLKNELDDY